MLFQLNDLPGYTDFTNLFDEYRVNSLTYRFMPRCTSVDSTFASNLNAAPTVITAIDDDGAYMTSSLNSMMQYGNCRFHSGLKPFTVKFTPTAFGSVQVNPVSGLTANQTKLKRKWFALSGGSTGAGIEHYGLAFFAELPPGNGATDADQYKWDVYVTADVSFRRTL